jgi:cell division protease FtsH
MSDNITNTESENSPSPESNPTPNENPSPEDERKKQFDKMKERFGKKSQTPFGGDSNNNGNSFYWIYGLVILALLAFVFMGQDFEGRVFPADQNEFEQNMLAKGDVRKIVIVNDKIAEITISADSLKLDRYKILDKNKSLTPMFPGESAKKGPHFKISIADKKDFIEQVRNVQTAANIPQYLRVSPSGEERKDWTEYMGWMFPIIIMIVLLY